MIWKWAIIEYYVSQKQKAFSDVIQLPGIPAGTELSPTTARMAARIWANAAELDEVVTVWSDDSYGYTLYPNSHEKVMRTWEYS